MAATTVVQTTVDAGLNDKAAAVLAEIGMTVEQALHLLLTQVVEQHDLPLSIHVPNDETVAAMNEAESGQAIRFASLDDLFAEMKR